MKRIILILFLTVLISACSNNDEVLKHHYLFSGEGEYWSAELDYHAEEVWGKDDNGVNIYSSEDDSVFTLTYKGDLEDLSKVKHIFYEYEAPTSSGSSSMTFDEPITSKEFKSRSGGTGIAVLREDMVVHVVVKWDDQEETFELVVEQ